MTPRQGEEESGHGVIPVSVVHSEVLAGLHALAFDDPWSNDAMRGFLIVATTTGYLAISDDGQPQGFVLCRVVQDEAEILTIAVAPMFRRKGIAVRLMECLAERLIELGVERLLLEVAVGNAPAQALYAALGFSQVGRRKNYYSRPDGRSEDALLMEVRPDEIAKGLREVRTFG